MASCYLVLYFISRALQLFYPAIHYPAERNSSRAANSKLTGLAIISQALTPSDFHRFQLTYGESFFSSCFTKIRTLVLVLVSLL